MRSLELNIYNISLINCNEIFADTISNNIVDCLYRFELLNKPISHIDVKKIIYHHVIHTLCEEILASRTDTKKVIFFNNTQLPDCDLFKFFDEKEILNILSQTMRYIKSHLPIRIYNSKYSLAYLEHLISIDDARGSMTINDINKHINKSYDKFNFSKIKKFTSKYELSFLNSDYFNRLTTKLLLTK